MSFSSVGVTEAASPDKRFHTWQRTISSTDVEDQYMLAGLSSFPTYTAIADDVSTATAASHLLMLQGDGTNYCYLLRAWVMPTTDVPAAATEANIQIVRTTTAGSSGSAVTAAAFDSADSAYGGTIQTLPSSKGTEDALLWQRRVPLSASSPSSRLATPYFDVSRLGKPIRWGPGTNLGIVFKVESGVASCTVDIVAEFAVLGW